MQQVEGLEWGNPGDRMLHCQAWGYEVHEVHEVAHPGMIVFLGAGPFRMAADVVDISPQDVCVRCWDLVRFQSKLACTHSPPGLSSSSRPVVHHTVAGVSEAA